MRRIEPDYSPKSFLRSYFSTTCTAPVVRFHRNERGSRGRGGSRGQVPLVSLQEKIRVNVTVFRRRLRFPPWRLPPLPQILRFPRRRRSRMLRLRRSRLLVLRAWLLLLPIWCLRRRDRT